MRLPKNLIQAFLLIVIVLFGACTAKTDQLPDNVRIRLSADNQSNWGDEAVGFIHINKDKFIYCPKIAVLDTGCNAESKMISSGYNTMNGTRDVSDSDGHGSIVIGKLLDLIDGTEIIPIKISDSDEISLAYLLAGLEEAIKLRPDIISMSLGTTVDYPEIADVIEQMIEQNVIVIAAAGNQGGSQLLFPAGYDGVISVLARDINNIDVTSNNKSETKRSFSAPGVKILIDGEYVTGSSIAVPYVTAIVSKIISVAGKGNLSAVRIEEFLRETALYPTRFSYGLVQYGRAVEKSIELQR